MSRKESPLPSSIQVDEICIPASFQLADGTLPFAYGDVQMDSHLLFNADMEEFINRMISYYYSKQIQMMLDSGLNVTPDSHPALYEQFKYCRDKICVNEDVEFLLSPFVKEINGLSFRYREKSYIAIGMRTPFELERDEIRFLLGHELGHVVIGHLNYHLAMGLVKSNRLFSFPFGTSIENDIEDLYNRWCRDSEYTADRAGLICCGSVDVVSSLIKRVTPRKRQAVLAEEFLSHPLLSNRLSQIELFQEVLQNTQYKDEL